MKKDTAPPPAPQWEVLPMQAEVKIHSLHTGSSVLADASITLNGCFAVRGVRVMNGSNGPFVSMPSYKTQGGYKDVCFPCTTEFHQELQKAVLDAYRQALTQIPQHQNENRGQEAPPAPDMKMR